MRWSFKLGRLGGIPIQVHATFLLLLLFEALTDGGLAGVLFTLVVFGVVVLHELGHALAARGFGIRTRDITLLPFGGVARLERMPEEPFQELVVALAGPAVNVGLALLSVGGLALVAYTPGLAFAGPFLFKFLFLNVGLALFNLLPAFPLDGGRALRALLATRLRFERATHIAARVGRVFAAGFAVLGIFVSPMLLVIAAFIWLAGKSEELMVAQRARPVFAEAPEAVHFRVLDSEGRSVDYYVRR